MVEYEDSVLNISSDSDTYSNRAIHNIPLSPPPTTDSYFEDSQQIASDSDNSEDINSSQKLRDLPVINLICFSKLQLD